MKHTIAASILILIFFCCAWQAQSAESIVFAIDPTKPPMQFIDDKGTIVGFEIDLLREMGRQAGFTPVFKQIAWQGIFEGLDKNKYDAVCASVSITDKRKENMSFTIPYYRVAQAVLAFADADIKSVSDLRGKKIGVKKETTSQQTIQNFQGVNLVKFNSVPEAIDELHARKIDAVICDGPIAGYYAMVEKNKNLKIVLVLEREKIELYGIAVKKGNNSLKNILNRAISSVQNNDKDIALQKKWFAGLLEAQ